MEVLLYSEGMKYIEQSGVGRAIQHQMKALELNNIPYTTKKNDKGYNILHINTVGPMSCHLAKKAKKQGKKVIMHAHSTEEDFKDSFFFANSLAPLFKRWLIHAYGLADELITPTPYSKKLIDSYNIGLKCTSVSNGIDLTNFQFNKQRGFDFRAKYHFKQSDKLVLSVGLQIKRKGILDFISIAKAMPDVKFIWCGFTSSFLLTREVLSALKHPPENVYFLGFVTDMIGAYSACDLFFMPTYEETEGIAILEALAMKKPVLTRRIPVYDIWLEDGFNCYKGAGNEEFEQKITGILNNKLFDTTEHGYDVVEERTLYKVGQQLKSIYNDLLAID